MTTVYTITFLEGEKKNLKFSYSSLEALYLAHEKDDLNVSKSRLYTVLSKENFYENEFISVEKYKCYTKYEVLDNQHKPH